jgi:hypothetical protein
MENDYSKNIMLGGGLQEILITPNMIYPITAVTKRANFYRSFKIVRSLCWASEEKWGEGLQSLDHSWPRFSTFVAASSPTLDTGGNPINQEHPISLERLLRLAGTLRGPG